MDHNQYPGKLPNPPISVIYHVLSHASIVLVIQFYSFLSACNPILFYPWSVDIAHILLIFPKKTALKLPLDVSFSTEWDLGTLSSLLMGCWNQSVIQVFHTSAYLGFCLLSSKHFHSSVISQKSSTFSLYMYYFLFNVALGASSCIRFKPFVIILLGLVVFFPSILRTDLCRWNYDSRICFLIITHF